MLVLHEVDVEKSRKQLEGVFNPICHLAGKVFSKHAGEGGMEFVCVWTASVEFHDPATKIVAEGEVNEGDLVVKLHDHCAVVF